MSIFSRRTILAFVAGAAAAGVAVAVGAAVVIGTGLYDTSASRPHNAIVAAITHRVFIQSTERRATALPGPAHFTAAEVIDGFRQFRQDCEVCHGNPGTARAAWVRGMNPTPPYLVDARDRWTPGQLYWIVANGAKMTGMPAWGGSKSPRDIRNLVAYLEVMPSIPPRRLLSMRAKLDGATAAIGPAPQSIDVRAPR